jgi:Na+/proline symporter
VFYTGSWLKRPHPEIGWDGGGWESVAVHYSANSEAWKLDLTHFTPEVLFVLIIPCFVLTVFMCSASQVQNQPMLLAKSESDIRRGVFICSLVNSMTTYPWVIIALVGMVLVPMFLMTGAPGDAATVTPRDSVPEFALLAFPPWLVGILMTALLAATLSTTAQLILASSHIVANDIFKRACNPKMKDRTFFILTRVLIVVFALIVIYPAMRQPQLMVLLYWVFSFAVPVFAVYLIGMLWKVNKVAAWTTLLAGYFASFFWTFYLQANWPSWIPGYFNENVYPTIVATLFFGIVMNLILPGKPGYLWQMKEAEKNNTPL